MKDYFPSKELFNEVFSTLKDVVVDYSQLEPVYASTQFPFSDDHKKAISKARTGGMWFYDPTTLQERYSLCFLPEPWVRGRSPKTKHGGRRGVYDESRKNKMRSARKYKSGSESPLYGRKRPEEVIAKLKESCKNRHIIKVSCLCCHKEFDLGNYCKHTNSKNK